MRPYVYILYQLARPFATVPPEALAALLLLVFTNPGVLAAVLFVLKFIIGIIVSGIIGWYLKALFEYYVWSELPPEHQRTLLAVRDRALPKKPDQYRPTNRDGVGCAPVGSRRKLYDRIVGGRSDTNIPFEQARNMLLRLGFEERVRGSHHIFTREGIEELIDIQEVGGECKPYQVKQMRAVLKKYNLRKEL
jgi:predicted RNA binding protein YcfA (HicA-like mRNA interferase family)